MMHSKPDNYTSLLKDIKSILQKGLVKAYKAVDNIKVQTYWQLGERIVREEIIQGRANYLPQASNPRLEQLKMVTEGFREVL